jgi:GTP-binding protein HflX
MRIAPSARRKQNHTQRVRADRLYRLSWGPGGTNGTGPNAEPVRAGDASNPTAEEQIQAVNGVLKELGCGDKPTLLVLNKVDRLTDRSYLDVLQKNHRRAVAVSAATGQGLDELREAVIEAHSAEFADVEGEVPQANGRVLSYLAAHAEICRQGLADNRVLLRCYLPRHLIQHIREPDVRFRLLEADGEPPAADGPASCRA